MATTDALPVPRKNVAFRAYFGIFKNDGTLITGATGITSTVINDGSSSSSNGTVTEVSTTGVYYLDLTNTEMNADCSVIKVTSTSTGAVPVVLPLYPQESGDIKVDIDSLAGQTAGVAALRRAFENMVVVTAGATNTSTTLSTGLSEASNDHYKGRPLYFLTGVLAGQIVEITAYNGSTKVLTFTATPTLESAAQNDLALIA